MSAYAIKKIGFLQYPKCSRCGAPMTLQKFYSLSEVFWGWKCLLCGEIVDPVILENRQRWLGESVLKSKKRKKNRKNQKAQYL